MTRKILGTTLLLAAVTTASGAAQGAPGIEVDILSPPSGQSLFGRQKIQVEVRSREPVDRVVFLLDGRPVGVRKEPPFAVDADAGEENRGHRVEVVAYSVSGARARAALLAPALRVDEEIDLELQQLYVTATDRKGRRVLDLEAGAFEVLDEGRRQQIVTFERGDIPFTALILLDGSQSMKGEKLEAALAGARAFVQGMEPLDEARLLVTADRLLEVSPFVGRGEPLAEALRGVAATGGTALYDSLFLALETLEPRQGRRVVIVLSDGYDAHSVLAMDDVREVARRSQALLYWLQLRDEKGALQPRTLWRDPDSVARDQEVLAAAVRDSGGRILRVSHRSQMAAAFQEILAELREQYAIGYYPDPRRSRAGWRTVDVRPEGRGLRLRWRNVYFDR